MEIERILVRLVADATQYTRVINDSQTRLLHFSADITSALSRNAIQLAMDYQRSAIAFEVMTKSATVSQKLLTDIRNLAVESPFQTSDLVVSAKQVMAFGFEVNDVIPVLSRLGDVSSATGTDMDRLILALGQVRTTGRLMGQELRQFTNAGVPILEYLAKVMNVTVAQVPNLVRQGRVGFADVARAFNMMTNQGGLFHGMMDRINKDTLFGRWQNLKETFQILGTDMGLAAFEGLRLGEVMTDISDLIRSFDKGQAAGVFVGVRTAFVAIVGTGKLLVEWFTDLGLTIRGLVVSVLEWIETHEKLVKVLKITAGVIAAVTVLSIALAGALRVLALVVTVLTALVRILTFVMAAFRVVVLLTTAAVAAASAVQLLMTAVANLFNPVTLTIAAIVGLIVALEQLGAFGGFGDAILDGFGRISTAAVEVWKGVKEAVMAGDMEGAFDLLFKGLEYGFKVLIASLHAEWVRFVFNLKFTVLEELGLLVAGMTQEIGQLGARIRLKIQPGFGDEEYRTELAKLNQDYNREVTKLRRGAAQAREEAAPTLNSRIGEILNGTEADRTRLMSAIMETRIKNLLPQGTARNIDQVVVRPIREAMNTNDDARFFSLMGNLNKFNQHNLLPNVAQAPTLQALGGVPAGFGMERTIQTQYDEKWTAVYEAVREVRKLAEQGKFGTPETEAAIQRVRDTSKALDDLSDTLMGVSDAAKKGAADIAIWPQVSTEANTLVKELTKELHEGIDPLERFTHGVGLLNEALQGPLPGLNAVIGPWATVTQPPGIGTKLNPLIDTPEYDYGLFKKYEDLRKGMPKPWEEKTPAMLQGSREAQATIDRSNAQSLSIQEQVLQTVREQTVLQREGNAYRKQVVEALKEIKNSGGMVGLKIFGGK